MKWLKSVFASFVIVCCAVNAKLSPVVPKCCPQGMNGFPANCTESSEPLLFPFRPWLNYSTRIAPLICNEYVFIESWEYKVDDAGNLELLGDTPTLEPPDNYCFEVHTSNDPEAASSGPEIGAFMCFKEESPTVVPSSYPIGMIISVPFLAVTAVTYAVIRKLWNLHGRCLVAQCTSLSLAYVFLIVIQLFTEDIPFGYCKLLGEHL